MGSKQSQYDIGLDKNAANYAPEASTIMDDSNYDGIVFVKDCRNT